MPVLRSLTAMFRSPLLLLSVSYEDIGDGGGTLLVAGWIIVRRVAVASVDHEVRTNKFRHESI